jgi:hypothetical protein
VTQRLHMCEHGSFWGTGSTRCELQIQDICRLNGGLCSFQGRFRHGSRVALADEASIVLRHEALI